MRKVQFTENGQTINGYFVGIAGIRPSGDLTMLLVESENGKIYSKPEYQVKFTNKPQNTTPIKRLDLKLMRNALVGINYTDMEKPYTIEDLIKLAEERNIIVEDTEGF